MTRTNLPLRIVTRREAVATTASIARSAVRTHPGGGAGAGSDRARPRGATHAFEQCDGGEEVDISCTLDAVHMSLLVLPTKNSI